MENFPNGMKNKELREKNHGAEMDENNRALSNTVWLQTNGQDLNNNGFHFQAVCWFSALPVITLYCNCIVHLLLLSLDQSSGLVEPCLCPQCLLSVWHLGTLLLILPAALQKTVYYCFYITGGE